MNASGSFFLTHFTMTFCTHKIDRSQESRAVFFHRTEANVNRKWRPDCTDQRCLETQKFNTGQSDSLHARQALQGRALRLEVQQLETLVSALPPLKKEREPHPPSISLPPLKKTEGNTQ